MSQRRVVVTGIGVVSPLGMDMDTVWSNLLAGKSGISRIECFDVSAFDCKIAGEIKEFDGSKFFNNPKDSRRNDRYCQLGVAASRKAVEDAGIDFSKTDRTRVGVYVGSGVGGILSLEEGYRVLREKGPSRVSPFIIPQLISNIAGGVIAIEHGLQGPSFSIVSACATAAHCIGEAYKEIKCGGADVFLAGGAEAAIGSLGIGGFAAMRALSTRNDEPEKASRPFDKDRDGFVMGEGGCVLVLEELSVAKARGAKIYAELVGYANTTDAYHITSPSPEGEGAARCLKLALASGGLATTDVDYINAHGTSTPVGDICETQAIKSVFGGHAKVLSVSSTKSMTGHLLGAAGAIETAVCVKAVQDDKIPPTINLDNPDPECDLDYTAHTARERKVNIAVNDSFGFGGHNAVLITKKFVG
ncbi:beta-ketoacyl-ACP synthase II [Oscillatoria laete-virens NRMC-F 0139]|nr:beta-ketoacyl-ACP synthase II [Oscillatoria laete-virens]MDL5053648.1 beta-ketoacyl-ACP synthase II [Oscillatoria laete-virens NRMC-F 0139]